MEARIQRSARKLRLGVILAMAIVCAVYLVARLGLDIAGVHVEYRAHGLQGGPPAVAADITIAFLLVAVVRLTQMLTLIGRGELFTPEVVRHFRGFAFWLLLMALCSFVAPTIMQAFNQGPGGHRFVVAVELSNLLMVAVTLLLFLLARLLERARAIDEEMREIV